MKDLSKSADVNQSTLIEGMATSTEGTKTSALVACNTANKKIGGVQGFIVDDYAADKNARREEFFERVRRALAKPEDASMFHGAARMATIRWRGNEY